MQAGRTALHCGYVSERVRGVANQLTEAHLRGALSILA